MPIEQQHLSEMNQMKQHPSQINQMNQMNQKHNSVPIEKQCITLYANKEMTSRDPNSVDPRDSVDPNKNTQRLNNKEQQQQQPWPHAAAIGLRVASLPQQYCCSNSLITQSKKCAYNNHLLKRYALQDSLAIDKLVNLLG